MKTTLFSLLVGSVALLGCGGGGGSTATDTTTSPGTTTAPTGTTTDTPATSTSDGPVTGTEANTMGGSNETTAPPVTSTTEEPVTTSLPSTTGPTSETDPSGTVSTGETTGGSEGTADTTMTDPNTTGGDPGGKCEKDSDCTLLSDCCRCEAIAVGDPIPPCEMMECLLPQCDALGIDEVSCRFGQCVAEKLNCDASAIACDQEPPDCPEGQLPGVNEDGTCWTNGCVPIDLCNVVPDCALCPAGQFCAVDETLFGPKRRCEPLPEECMGKPTCACASQACDQGPFDTCAENDDGLWCSCPVC